MRKNRAGGKTNGYRMLALDDDTNITDALKAYFEASGFAVDTESDPIRALERMRKKKYHILLLDFLMRPICGDEVVKELRAFDTDVFIILLTGHKELAPPLNTLRELDIQGYYEKSERFDQLELLIESCIKSIRQMRTIQEYRDGLSGILAASTAMHQLGPVNETMETVLKSIGTLSKTKNAFVLIEPDGLQAEYADAINGALNPMYRGSGSYNISEEQFTAQVLPNLAEGYRLVARTHEAAHAHNLIIAPLLSENGRRLGLIGANVNDPIEDHLLKLFGLFARQASAALINALLHSIVTDKRAELAEAYRQLQDSYLETISALRLIVDAKDIYTRGHSDRVAELTSRLAMHIKKDAEFIERVRVAGLFHDIGKVGTSDSVLTKEGLLTEEEYEHIKRHPTTGANILRTIRMFSEFTAIIEAHHERWDGKGYPHGLTGENIPVEARMIAIADSYDAMTSNRHYRPSLGAERAKQQLGEGRGSQFDAKLVDAFLEMLEVSGGIEVMV